MVIVVKSDMMIKDLKKQFHIYYPQLKIEFFRTEHDVNGGNNKSNMLGNETMIRDYTGNREGQVEFSGSISVAEFEQRFSEQFGLNLQVFRKSGDIYLETTGTDDWSLDQEHKEALGSLVKSEEGTTDFTDRDKWE
jgi:hypothetical protein